MKNTVSNLTAVANCFGLSNNGNKGSLFNHICDYKKKTVTKTDNPVTFDSWSDKQVQGDFQKWISLTPSAADQFVGTNMAMGA